MRSPRVAFSLAAAGLLAATLGLKAALNDFDDRPDIAGHRRALAARLVEQGFTVRVQPQLGEQTLLRAERGGCRMALRPLADDQAVSALRLQAPDLPRQLWIDHGRARPDFPGLGFVLSNFVERAAIRLGLAESQYRPLQAAMSAPCDPGQIDFGDQRIGRLRRE